MKAIKNKVQLIGHLGVQPEIRSFESGAKVARMRMATNETYKNAEGERATETVWHHLVAWGHLAEIAEKYLQKGSELMIEGRLTNRQYTDKQGATRYITEIQVNELLMLDKKGNKAAVPAGAES
jgi:single-strand DNA-binding protein